MSLPFTLPDWLPWWVPILLLVPALMYALAFLFMPFSVIGLKGRLEAVEARLDEIQGEIRGLALRLPEPMRTTSYDDVYAPPVTAPPRRREEAPSISRPPIPPAAYDVEDEDPRTARLSSRRGDQGRGDQGKAEPPRPGRTEPRLDWPR
jgi:hypothetical protein